MICPLCSSKNFSVIHKSRGYEIVRCHSCGLRYLRNPPAEIPTIYNQNYFDDKHSGDFMADAKKKFKFVKPYLNEESKILDFGCGVGDFSGICKNNGYDVLGFDVSQYAAEYTSKTYGVVTKFGKLSPDLFLPGTFNIITCFDVIEHIPDFLGALRVLNSWLKAEGKVFITTPNIESWDARLLGKYWYGFTKLPQHLLYFSPKSLELALKKSEFKETTIHQWGFVRSLGFLFRRSFPPYLFFPMIDLIAVVKK